MLCRERQCLFADTFPFMTGRGYAFLIGRPLLSAEGPSPRLWCRPNLPSPVPRHPPASLRVLSQVHLTQNSGFA